MVKNIKKIEMKTKFIIVIIAILSITITACNKEKRYSKRLIKGQVWNVKNITIDDSSLNVFGQWLVVQDVNIYETVPRVSWTTDTSGTIFEWQFQQQGDIFQLNYNHDILECDNLTLSNLDYLSYDLTGTYDVEKHGRKEMKFTSTQTIKYPNQKVEILIERL